MHFTHDYYKLAFKIFPTIRSTKYVKKHKIYVGWIEEVFVKGNKRGYSSLLAIDERIIP